jgi:hypothetical protein
MSSAQRNPLVNFAANLFPWQQKKPSIVEYVEAAKYVGGGTRERNWPRSDEYREILFLSHIANFGLKATLVWAASSLLSISINCTAKTNMCNNINAIRDTAAAIAVGTAISTALLSPFDHMLSPGTFLTLAQRKKRGEDAAESLFDGVVTDDGLFNGSELLTALQNFYATRKLFENDADPAAISYVENGDAAIEAILLSFDFNFDFNGDKSNILTEAKAKLRYYNDLPTDEDQKKYFPNLTAQFTDPKFVYALALGIFNGDNHQGLVKALARYGDKDELHKAMIYLCTNASVFIDVATKLQERIPDLLDPKIVSKARELEQRRFVLIKDCPDIAEGFGLKLRSDKKSGVVNAVVAAMAQGFGLDLSPDADIDAVNAAFAALDISGVVHLPSKANDDNPEDRLEAQFAALETGTAAARAALNPQQQATMARLEQGVDEGLGGGR